MGKKLKNPIEVRIVRQDENINTSFHYGLECEYGDLGRKGYEPDLTPQEQSLIEKIVDKALIKISEHEEIV